MKVRPGFTLLWYRPPCFLYVNDVVMLISEEFTKEKQWGFYQNTVNSSLTFIQRPGN